MTVFVAFILDIHNTQYFTKTRNFRSLAPDLRSKAQSVQARFPILYYADKK
jgi:hypothetical protein